jgi:hypothetical protein
MDVISLKKKLILLCYQIIFIIKISAEIISLCGKILYLPWRRKNMAKMLIFIGLLSVMACLTGCGAATNVSSRFESSKAAYMRGLEQNPDNPERCAALREAYEADVRAFRNVSQGLTRRGVLSPD